MTKPSTRPKLRIALLGAGNSIHLHRLAEDLSKRGHTVSIITSAKFAPLPELKRVQVFTFGMNISLLSKTFQIRKILKKLAPHVLHSHYVNYGGFAAFATGFHPNLLSAWGSDILELEANNFARKFMTKLTVKSADSCLPVSKHLQARLLELGASSTNNVIVSWGVNTAHFSRRQGDSFRRSLGIKDEFLVLSPRVLDPLYNQESLINAFSEFVKIHPHSKLVIVKLRADENYLRSLQRLVGILNIREKILFIDQIAFDNLPSAYSEASVVVSIPTTDGTPMTVLEAMSCESAVIVCDVPSLREWMNENTWGALVDPQDPEKILEGLIKVKTTDVSTLEKLKKINRQVIEDGSASDMCLERLENIYYGFLTAKPGMSWLKTLCNILGLRNDGSDTP